MPVSTNILLVRIFRISKFLHKYIGLALFLLLMWMSLSGILLNHPDIISGFSVPGYLTPSRYHYKNWNRSTIVNMLFSKANPDLVFAGGREGMWISRNGGYDFESLNRSGFTSSRYYRRVNSLMLIEDIARPVLLAGTWGGLFAYDLMNEKWKAVTLLTSDGKPESNEKVVKIIRRENELFVFTNSKIYKSNISDYLNLKQVAFSRREDEKIITLIEAFFEIHSGKAWGLPGQLIYDAAGIILFFLSLSGIFIWYLPKKQNKKLKNFISTDRVKHSRFYNFLYKYHLKLGIWLAALLFIISATGFFMRPPVIALITDVGLPIKYYPAIGGDSPWKHKIRNAYYDDNKDKFVIDATDGRWESLLGQNNVFAKAESPVPVFVMGATVFESLDSLELIGSFNGIFGFDGKIKNLMTDEHQNSNEIDNLRPDKYMITGFFTTPEGGQFVSTHQHGILQVGDSKRRGRFKMPEELEADFRFPLWNYMFELHNGRIFKGLIGGFYILLVPLSALLTVLIILSGVYDWISKKVLKIKLKI